MSLDSLEIITKKDSCHPLNPPVKYTEDQIKGYIGNILGGDAGNYTIITEQELEDFDNGRIIFEN